MTRSCCSDVSSTGSVRANTVPRNTPWKRNAKNKAAGSFRFRLVKTLSLSAYVLADLSFWPEFLEPRRDVRAALVVANSVSDEFCIPVVSAEFVETSGVDQRGRCAFRRIGQYLHKWVKAVQPDTGLNPGLAQAIKNASPPF